MLKFNPEVFGLHGAIPPLKGARGMFFDTNSHYYGNYRCYIPPTPFKGGENPCKSPNFVQKINALKFAKTELNSPAQKGGTTAIFHLL